MVKLKIRLTRYGDTGWQFAPTGASTAARYRTNLVGDGLWQYVKSTTQWYAVGSPFSEFKQSMGTCQFRLPAARKAAYDAIRYQWSKPE